MSNDIVSIIHVPEVGFVNIWRDGNRLDTVWYHDTARYDYWVKRAKEWNSGLSPLPTRDALH